MGEMHAWFVRIAAGSLAGLLAVVLVQPVSAQLRRKAEKATEAAPREVAPAPGEAREAARDAGQDIREAARDAADDARRAGAPREAREAVREGRQEGREIRREGREAAREVRDLASARGADFGLWFNTRAGADAGLVIADVAAEGAIAKVGFREGDRIVSINGQKVATEREFMRLLFAEEIRNERVKVIVFRGGREQILYVQPTVLVTEIVDYDPLWRYGIVIDDRTPGRIVILRVYPRTPAYYAGLRAGDVVVGLRGQRINAVADMARAFADADDPVAIQVSRGNRTRELDIDVSADADVRTTLRPDADAGTRLDGRARTRVEGDVETRPARPADDRPRLDRPVPDRPAADKPAADKPAADKPATPEVPKAKPTRPEVPAVPDVPGEAPKLPDAPKPPAVPLP